LTCVSGPLSLVNNLACQKTRLWLDGMAANPTDRFHGPPHRSQESRAGLGSRPMPRILDCLRLPSFHPRPAVCSITDQGLGCSVLRHQCRNSRAGKSFTMSTISDRPPTLQVYEYFTLFFSCLACAVGMRAFGQGSSTVPFNLWQQQVWRLARYLHITPRWSTALKELQPAHSFHY
jgi:hypothetical protein